MVSNSCWSGFVLNTKYMFWIWIRKQAHTSLSKRFKYFRLKPFISSLHYCRSAFVQIPNRQMDFLKYKQMLNNSAIIFLRARFKILHLVHIWTRVCQMLMPGLEFDFTQTRYRFYSQFWLLDFPACPDVL